MAETNPTARVHEEEEAEQVVFFNATRHEHELCLFEGLPAYTCSGCKENGANIGYRCRVNGSSHCKDFTLHEACATLPDVFQHPFRRLFKFRPKTRLRHHCGACRDVLRGYVFQRPDHFKLHPLCMVLPEKLKYGGHANHQLKFLTGDLQGGANTCSACYQDIKSSHCRYRCEKETCMFCVDLSCAKIDFYGLSHSDIAIVAPISRSNRRFMSTPAPSGKWVAAAFLKGAIKGPVETVIGMQRSFKIYIQRHYLCVIPNASASGSVSRKTRRMAALTGVGGGGGGDIAWRGIQRVFHLRPQI